MCIEFDDPKNEVNVRDRGLNFERAPERPTLVAVGFLGTRLHVLCFTPVAAGIRVISFRKANAREVRDYDQTRTID